jgi:hypothetical protein
MSQFAPLEIYEYIINLFEKVISEKILAKHPFSSKFDAAFGELKTHFPKIRQRITDTANKATFSDDCKKAGLHGAQYELKFQPFKKYYADFIANGDILSLRASLRWLNVILGSMLSISGFGVLEPLKELKESLEIMIGELLWDPRKR